MQAFSADPDRPTTVSVRTWLGVAARVAGFGGVLLWPAGTWRWWEAWVMIGLWSLFAVSAILFLSRHDPALLAERLKTLPVQRGQKRWDQRLMAAVVVIGVGLVVLPGLDVIRFRWHQPFPVWLELGAMALHLPLFGFLGWIMYSNSFLASVVKIDTARNHHVVTSGPYAWVRHPMYVAVIILVFATVVALGSPLGLVPAALLAALVVLRTRLEDHTLLAELDGYREYARTTRYRLLPGVW
jgi:protein-S-isoprenylcysteine O-methyltransferase Ste14